MARNFKSPRYAYGGGRGKFVYAIVVDVNDPEQAGRVKARVIGYQDDIKDEDLHWSRPETSQNAPQHSGIGISGTGLVKGSVISGYYTDNDQQFAYTGSIGKSGEDDDKGNFQQDGTKHDFPKPGRDKKTDGGDFRLIPDNNDAKNNKYDNKSITTYAKDESENPYGRQNSKDGNESPEQSWSLGMYEYKDF